MKKIKNIRKLKKMKKIQGSKVAHLASFCIPSVKSKIQRFRVKNDRASGLPADGSTRFTSLKNINMTFLSKVPVKDDTNVQFKVGKIEYGQ